MQIPTPSAPETFRRSHLLTIGLEDYYHVGTFNRLIQRGQWYRFERRLEANTRRTMDLLDEFGIKATFFVLGWVADTVPELLADVVARGHEVGNKGYYHRGIHQMTREEFRDDLVRAEEAIERATNREVLGYRVAREWFDSDDLWALDVLADAGYLYDSSVAVIGRRFRDEPWRRFAHAHHRNGRMLWEFPISSIRPFGLGLPIAGGNYIRQLPHAFMSRAVSHWDKTARAPFVMYFHVWEMDPDQPRISAASFLARIRQYRNLGKVPQLLRHYFARYRFTSVAEHLGVTPEVLQRVRAVVPISRARAVGESVTPIVQIPIPIITPATLKPNDRVPVTIVVPCYNEELVLPYLANTLESVSAHLAPRYDLRFVFIDDHSTDDTLGELRRLFGARSDCKLVHHTRNEGVAAGILTGMRNAETEIVCSIDGDCTYDPHELANMIPLLVDGVDVVTASPYHPEGQVRNVPSWRLSLSKSLSVLYRVVLHQQLHTYTSCFRVYRRSAILPLRLKRGGFLGVAEMLGRLDLRGARIVEHPATLEVRMIGRSKMKVARTIAGHLRLLVELAARRLAQRLSPAAPESPARPALSAAVESVRDARRV